MTQPVFIGVDIGGTSVRAGRFTGHDHTPHPKVKQPTFNTNGRDALLQQLEDIVREVAPEGLGGVAGVGMSAPGPLDPRAGVVLRAPNLPGWESLPLKAIMERRLGCPVYVGNDANLAALGEWKFGAGAEHRDVVYLTISTGIGGGFIVDDRMVVGARGLAAEVGHLPIQPDGPLCGCGQRGCLEALASGTAIGRIARQRLAAGEGRGSTVLDLAGGRAEAVTGAIVGRAALAGDAFAICQIDEAGRHIGFAVAGLLHLLNPSIVILGGGVSLLGDLLLEPVREAARARSMSDEYWRDCPIVPAALGDDAGLVGAATLAMQSGAS